MAYIKLCPECESRSISASKDNWTCPHCGENLNDEPVFSQIKIEKKWWNKTDSKSEEKVLA